MAEVNENVFDAEVVKSEETGMTTTSQPAAPEETKTDIVGKVKTGAKVAVAAGAVVLAFFAGLTKGKAKKEAAKETSREDVVDAEPTSNEDEVQE